MITYSSVQWFHFMLQDQCYYNNQADFMINPKLQDAILSLGRKPMDLNFAHFLLYPKYLSLLVFKIDCWS